MNVDVLYNYKHNSVPRESVRIDNHSDLIFAFFEAKFMMLYGDAPRPPDLKPGMIYDMHGTGRASSLIVLRDRAQCFVVY